MQTSGASYTGSDTVLPQRRNLRYSWSQNISILIKHRTILSALFEPDSLSLCCMRLCLGLDLTLIPNLQCSQHLSSGTISYFCDLGNCMKWIVVTFGLVAQIWDVDVQHWLPHQVQQSYQPAMQMQGHLKLALHITEQTQPLLIKPGHTIFLYVTSLSLG